MSARSAELPPAIFLLGPTACGKTDLALRLRETLPVDLISVDSAMIYRGMDIGTAKPDAATLARHPHRLVDIREPAEAYSVAEFLRDARREMLDISASGRIPLLVGGTMLYFRALLEGLAALPSADAALRERLSARAGREGWPALYAELARLDPAAAGRIHPNHSQRILRALEVCLLAGRPLSALYDEALPADLRPVTEHFRVVQLGLVPDERAALHRRIEARFSQMLELGLIEEVEALWQRGDLTADLPSIRCVGYRQVWEYLAGRCDYEEMALRGAAATRQLAKRQLTWMRGWPGLEPVSVAMRGGLSRTLDETYCRSLKILRSKAIYIATGASYH